MSDVLPLLHLPSYTLPGLFLLTVMGLAPLLLTYGLIARSKWAWADSLTRWSRHHWAWTGSLAVGVVLMIWLAIQALLIGFRWPIQTITAGNGVLIVLFALVPKVRLHYAAHR